MGALPWRQLRDESIARLAAAGIEDPAGELRWIAERSRKLVAAHRPRRPLRLLGETGTERR